MLPACVCLQLQAHWWTWHESEATRSRTSSARSVSSLPRNVGQRSCRCVLYVRAGILDPDDHPATSVEMAVLADVAITERQKRVLMDVYTSFVKENERAASNGQAPK
jgi:hypothetical protein